MSSFLKGFQKAAKRERSDIGTAAAIGAGVAGTKATAEGIRSTIRDRREGKVKVEKNITSFEKKLKPGDIIFSRDPKSKYRFNVGDRTLPFTEKSMIQAGVGSSQYHAGLYTGKGKMFHASGVGQVGKDWLESESRGKDVMAYRPGGASKREVTEALKQPKRMKGRQYKTTEELISQAKSTILSPKQGPKACYNVKGRTVCTNVVASAYPKQFKKEFATIDQMKGTKGMTPIARYSRVAPPSAREKILSRVAYPAIRNLKWAPLAAAAAYGVLKANELFSKDPVQRDIDIRKGKLIPPTKKKGE